MPASTPPATTIAKARYTPRDVIVRSWPLADGGWPPKLLLLLSVILAAIAGSLAQSPATGVIIGTCLLLALWQIWIPVRYEISPQGVTQFSLGRQRRIPWSAIGRIERRRTGVVVFRDAGSAPLDALRSLFIPYGAQSSELLASFDFYLAGRAS
ncbi:MAG TPA: hypothetical protein VL096_07840 [Pirellulaceae bacterium]|nr:hypothetical protein [Pirellulaceae bacterium]